MHKSDPVTPPHPTHPPRCYTPRVEELLRRRAEVQARYDAGERPRFLPETQKVGALSSRGQEGGRALRRALVLRIPTKRPWWLGECAFFPGPSGCVGKSCYAPADQLVLRKSLLHQ